VTGSGDDRDEDDESPSSGSDDDFLRAVAAAPVRTMPSVLRHGEDDPEHIGHFAILSRLGQGGMGIVYQARDENLGRVVALKVLPTAFETDQTKRGRFMREARSAAAVTHPNIATIYEVGESEGRIFIAMELVEGPTLRRIMGDRPLELARALRLFGQIAAGVAKAHGAAIVHRDLKPDNVVVGSDELVKVLDFGLAKSVEADALITRSGEELMVGTPAYMPPEQVRGQLVTPASDVFAMGVMLYEMLTARRPFGGKTLPELVASIERDTPTTPSAVNPKVPAALDRIVVRCLSKEPAGRYATAGALLEELRRFESIAPPPAVRTTGAGTDSVVTPPPSSATPRRRGPSWRWGLVALGVVAAGGGVAALSAKRWSGSSSGASGASGSGSSVVLALAPPSAVLACPPLLASGVDEPSGWLGAAAASLACRRAAILMGGNLSRVQVPAELLDLPRQPSGGLPLDPYTATDARDRSIAAAKARATRWLDGSVARDSDRFRVTLVVRAQDGHEVARGEGQGRQMYQAVREAMRPLVALGAVPRAPGMDAEIAQWWGVRDVELAATLDDWHTSLGVSAAATAEEWTKLALRHDELGARWAYDAFEAQGGAPGLNAPVELTALDRSSPAAFAASAPSYALSNPRADPVALATEARRMADAEASSEGKRALVLAAVELLSLAGQPAARELVLGLLRLDPRSDHAWEMSQRASAGEARTGPLMRAYTAWAPEDQASWEDVAFTDDSLDSAQRIAWARRAYLIAADWSHWGLKLGEALVRAGRGEDARALAGEMLLRGPVMDEAAQGVLVRVDASEAHFGAALDRGMQLLQGMAVYGAPSDWSILNALLDVAVIVGKAPALADAFALRFVLVDPPRLVQGHVLGRDVPDAVARACALSSRDVSKRCFARVHDLLVSKYFRWPGGTSDAEISGLARFGAGDMKGAAEAWRPLAQGDVDRRLFPVAFDASGDVDVAERVDAKLMASGDGNYDGVSLSHVRSALRAMKRGDRERAKQLAQQVVDAWGAADVPVPPVAAMKALLARLR
jgi:serine/threonine protein kinase